VAVGLPLRAASGFRSTATAVRANALAAATASHHHFFDRAFSSTTILFERRVDGDRCNRLSTGVSRCDDYPAFHSCAARRDMKLRAPPMAQRAGVFFRHAGLHHRQLMTTQRGQLGRHMPRTFVSKCFSTPTMRSVTMPAQCSVAPPRYTGLRCQTACSMCIDNGLSMPSRSRAAYPKRHQRLQAVALARVGRQSISTLLLRIG